MSEVSNKQAVCRRSGLLSFAEEIIRNRIRTAVCIDDDYKGAYSAETNAFERELYMKLFETGCKFILMQPFPYNEDEEESWLKETDLVLLDWKLLRDGKNEFVPALQIVSKVIQESNCSMICIYTNEPQIGDIYDVLQTYFEACNYDSLLTIKKDLEPLLIEYEDELLSLADEVIANVQNDGVLTKRIAEINQKETRIKNQLFPDGKMNDGRINELTKEVKLFSLYKRHNFEHTAHIESVSLRRVFSETKEIVALNINNKLITVINKEESTGSHKVKPEELINHLATAVYKEPNQLYHLLHLYYQTCGRSVIESNSAFANTVTNRILSKLLKLHGDSYYLDRELRVHFSEDITSSMILHATSLEQVLEEEIRKETREPSIEEIMRFNAFYSQVKCPDSSERHIGFGDVFEIPNYEEYNRFGIKRYLLCVTAHCDCAHAEERKKIRLCFHFALGEENKNRKEAVTNPESVKKELEDFIRLPDNNCISIKWDNYLASIYLKSHIISNGEINEAEFKGQIFGLKYIGTLKEQYAERIANRVYSHATRVGITYLGQDINGGEVTS